MKRIAKSISVFTAMLVIVLFAACSDKKQEKDEVTKHDVKKEYKEALQKTSELIDKEVDQLQQTRLVDKMESTIESIDSKMDELKAKVKNEKEANKKEVQEGIEKLEDLKVEVKAELNKVQETTADNWEKLKAESNSKYIKLKAEVDETIDELEKKWNSDNS